MSTEKRIPSLDGLRGIAAIAVMFFHFLTFFLPQANLFGLRVMLGKAYLAVDLFFILSGFVMAQVYGAALAADPAGNWRAFARARIARIYPLFALTLLATVADVALFSERPPYVAFSGESLMLQPFLLQQWWPTGLNWNYPTWSISTEMEAYVFFVFAAAPLLTGRHPRVTALSCMGVVAALSFMRGGDLNQYAGFPALARTLAEFSLGVLLFRTHKRGLSGRWLGVLAVAFAGLGILTHQDFLIVVGLICLTLYSIGTSDVVGRILNSRPAVALGNWSYSIYLWHVPVHMAVMGFFPVSSLSFTGARVLAIGTGVFVVGISAVTYRYFEKPMREMITGVALYAT